VANVVDPDTSREVDIFLALDVGDHRAFGLGGKDGMGIEGSLRDIFVPFI